MCRLIRAGTLQQCLSPCCLGHGDRHVSDPGAACAEILQSLPPLQDIGGPFWGKTQNHLYRAFPLPNGDVNIGTYFYRYADAMLDQNFSPLTTLEKSIVMKLVSVLADNGNLVRQIDAARVKRIDDYGSLEFDFNEAAPYVNVSGPLVTGQQEDIDTTAIAGPYINFILIIKAGLITELDIYKDDGTRAVATYNPEKLFLSLGLSPDD